MSTDVSTEQARSEGPILEFARAFRAAARAVGFYPPSHPAVVSSLESVQLATKHATAAGPLGLTVLPDRLLAGGEPLKSTDHVFADVSRILHRHGIGALNVNARATIDSWLALLGLLARKPEDVRAAGGIQREWLALQYTSPRILEIDFGELLRGRIGGDFAELAGIIDHYLEAGGVGSSPGEDVCASLVRVVEEAVGAQEAVTAIVRELKTAVLLTRAAHPDRLDEVFRQASKVGERLNEEIMAGLLACRGTSDAMAGTMDVVTTLVDEMSDTTIAQFLTNAIITSGRVSSHLAGVFASLVSDPARRRTVLAAVQQAMAERPASEVDFVREWGELEHQLEAHSDRQFVPERYAREIQAARSRSAELERRMSNPPERMAAWMQSLDDESIRELDLKLLADLARLETDPLRWPEVLDVLRAHVCETAEAGNWEDAASVVEAIERETSTTGDGARRSLASETRQKLAASRVSDDALTKLGEADSSTSRALTRLVCAMGPALVPEVAQRWMTERRAPVRERLEQVVTEYGPDGREALRRLLDSKDPELRRAAIRLLRLARGMEHLPALEMMLRDPYPDIQREALEALAAVPSDRADDFLARGIARADDLGQKALLEHVLALGYPRAVPILRRLLTRLDQHTVDRRLYVSIIDGLKRAGSDEAVAALGVVFRQSRWRAPIRRLRFRAAARAALRAIDGPAAAGALRESSFLRHLRPARWRRHGPGQQQAPPRTGVGT